MYDVRPEQYTTVIREMIRHEDDVTNHRIMWLLIGQGFIANAFVSRQETVFPSYLMLSLAGILVTLSAFVMLYKSYKARGYLQFLGEQAKDGRLEAAYLPIVGWPKKRIKCWWKEFWICPWFGQAGDVLEPWMSLPGLFLLIWMATLLQQQSGLDLVLNVILAGLLTAVMLPGGCLLISWYEGREE